jgi:1,4-alpha-glucan branching enzyme
VLACVANFAAIPHEGYRLGLPYPGRWDELINTDADVYFGSGVGNFGGVEAVEESWHGQPASTRLRVPPLGALWLRYAGPPGGADADANAQTAVLDAMLDGAAEQPARIT